MSIFTTNQDDCKWDIFMFAILHLDVYICSYYMNVKMQNYKREYERQTYATLPLWGPSV